MRVPLLKVLDELEASGLKLSIDKCQFVEHQSNTWVTLYLEGASINPDKIKGLTIWPHPRNYRELKTSLRFSGYYLNLLPEICEEFCYHSKATE